MDREIELQKYLPNFLAEFRELNRIMIVENPEFQLTTNEITKIIDNLFISTCNEKGITRFESMMKIIPLETDTLESRRSRILTRWYAALPYSWFYLIRKLNSLCGNENYEIELKNKEYLLNLKTHLDMSGQVEELLYLLNYVLPANLMSNITNEIVIKPTNEIKTTVAISFCDVIQISDGKE